MSRARNWSYWASLLYSAGFFGTCLITPKRFPGFAVPWWLTILALGSSAIAVISLCRDITDYTEPKKARRRFLAGHALWFLTSVGGMAWFLVELPQTLLRHHKGYPLGHWGIPSATLIVVIYLILWGIIILTPAE
jgi:hypothetical protein